MNGSSCLAKFLILFLALDSANLRKQARERKLFSRYKKIVCFLVWLFFFILVLETCLFTFLSIGDCIFIQLVVYKLLLMNEMVLFVS